MCKYFLCKIAKPLSVGTLNKIATAQRWTKFTPVRQCEVKTVCTDQSVMVSAMEQNYMHDFGPLLNHNTNPKWLHFHCIRGYFRQHRGTPAWFQPLERSHHSVAPARPKKSTSMINLAASKMTQLSEAIRSEKEGKYIWHVATVAIHSQFLFVFSSWKTTVKIWKTFYGPTRACNQFWHLFKCQKFHASLAE